MAQGVDLSSGYRRKDAWKETFDVGGILLPRPFKITKVGPVRWFVRDIQAVLQFYTHGLGLGLIEQADVLGHTCYFLRTHTEHHALAIYPEALRLPLGIQHSRSLLGFGVQLGSYAQLRAAVTFMGHAGYQPVNMPPALSPGMGHQVWLQDPYGNAVQLFWEMEQIGWSGLPRPTAQRRAWPQNPADWPEHIEPQQDSFMGEVFLGPLN
jgi:catechol 2,3-dioxygenase-like lactoylglutathione lyase family enzyme